MSTAKNEQDWKENNDTQMSSDGFATHLAAIVLRWRSLQRASFRSRLASSSHQWMSRSDGDAPASVRS
jgi:hypothetical protein